MPAPVRISYATFLANAQPADVRALALLSNGDVIKTMDPVEADSYQAIGVRLYNAGLLTRFRRSLEVQSGETWQVFDGRVDPVAMTYIADAAKSFIEVSQQPEPAP